MFMLGRSVHLTTFFFLGKLDQEVNQYFVHILSLVTDNNPSSISGREENESVIFSLSVSTKVWDQVGTVLATPGSALRHAVSVRHVTDFATRPSTGCCIRYESFSIRYRPTFFKNAPTPSPEVNIMCLHCKIYLHKIDISL